MFNKIKNMNKLFQLRNNGQIDVKMGRFCYVNLNEAEESFQTDLDNWWSF